MQKRLIGGILLIVGTSIGGGMLALPMAVAAGSYPHASFLFVSVWLLMMFSALFLLEVNLWFPDGANLISMARKTLGRSAEVITWLFYLLLLYTLLSAYETIVFIECRVAQVIKAFVPRKAIAWQRSVDDLKALS